MPGDNFAAKIEALRRQLVEMERQAPSPDIAGDPVVGPTFEELHTALEELHIAEEELTRRNQELTKTQDSLIKAHSSLEEERSRYHDLFEFAPDGYLITDGEGAIWQANRAAGFMLRT